MTISLTLKMTNTKFHVTAMLPSVVNGWTDILWWNPTACFRLISVKMPWWLISLTDYHIHSCCIHWIRSSLMAVIFFFHWLITTWQLLSWFVILLLWKHISVMVLRWVTWCVDQDDFDRVPTFVKIIQGKIAQ